MNKEVTPKPIFSGSILVLLLTILTGSHTLGQKVNTFPDRSAPLHQKVEIFTELMLGNHWNEGAIMRSVIFPPAGHERPIVGGYADNLDPTSQMLAAFSHKYAVTKDPADRLIANQIAEAIFNHEKVTGIPGLVARGFYRTDAPLWHETLWYDEWNWSETMPGYRWLGDLSTDKFTSLFYGLGTYWEFCADESYKEKVAGFLNRFMGRVVDHNFKLVDPDGKMTLWGNMCPDLPHQPLNSLKLLAGLKTTYHITGNERFSAAYNMLIDRYHYDDRVIKAKLLFPAEWRGVGDDYHAARSLYMLLRWEDNKDLLNKYRMSLNRHWHAWKDIEFTWECNIWDIMVYQVLTGEDVIDERVTKGLKEMWGFDRGSRIWNVPDSNGEIKKVESEFEGTAAAMIRNYWFGIHYGIINPAW